MDRLTEHFTFREMTKTNQSLLQDENRLQAEAFRCNMIKVCNELEKLREFIFRPIYITSGFRYLALNKAVGGSFNSQHMTGSAADFTVKDFMDEQGLNFVYSWCANHLDYGQLNLVIPNDRGVFIHIGLPRDGREKTRFIFERGEKRAV